MIKGVKLLRSINRNKVNIQLIQKQKYWIIDTHEYEKEMEQLKLSKVRAFLKEFVYLLKEGTKDTYRDLKWMLLLYKRKSYKHFTGFEKREHHRILKDTFKFIPFSLFLIIPAGEIFLPLYLALFPNSVPTQYTFDHTWDQYIEEIERKQRIAHEDLVKPLRDFLIEEGMNTEDFLEDDIYQKYFFNNLNKIELKLNYREFDSDNLIKICQFLGMQYMTGTNIISTLLKIFLNLPRYLINIYQMISGSKHRTKWKHWIFNYEIKLNFFPFEFFKRRFLLFQIQKHLERIRQQDISFYSFGMHDVQGIKIKDIARERGIISLSCYETLKAVINHKWLSACMTLNNNAMIYYALMQYDILQNTNSEFN